VSDPNLTDLATGAGGGAGLIAALWALVARGWKREDRTEGETADALKSLAEGQHAMQRTLDSISQALGTHAATVSEVKARVDGMSNNYGSRISGIEKLLERLDERIEERTGRAK
jgi:phage shock protein A